MTPSAQTLLRWGARRLEASAVPNSFWTAEQLLAGRLGCQTVELHVESPSVPEEVRALFETDVASRSGGMPLQYLTQTAGFYGRDFAVGPGVFIPRPETEVLVETALEILTHSPLVVDVGTGSGAIAITLALERPGLQVLGVDQFSIPLRFARANARRHGARVQWVQADLGSALAARSVDLLAANLPYLDPAQSDSWGRELFWEPWAALNGGSGGLHEALRLLRQASAVLKPDGGLLLEIVPDQVEPLKALARANGFRWDRVVRDLAGLDRVVLLWKN
ncbi:MAG: peptide chain release factor N(5)-glutamine methyltransferase [Candidatus Omnitrophica bacterium]|nr:peptide chain release factor N(5)-glutamine methyltransferase [Candidatus Omnitrophota bacterium]